MGWGGLVIRVIKTEDVAKLKHLLVLCDDVKRRKTRWIFFGFHYRNRQKSKIPPYLKNRRNLRFLPNPSLLHSCTDGRTDSETADGLWTDVQTDCWS